MKDDPVKPFPLAPGIRMVRIDRSSGRRVYGGWPSNDPPDIPRWLHIAWLAAAWIVVQLLLGLVSRTEGMAIATAAHVGGFIAGLVLARPLLLWRYRKA